MAPKRERRSERRMRLRLAGLFGWVAAVQGLFAGLSHGAWVDDPALPPPVTAAQRLVQQLGAPDFATREAAQAAVAGLGPPAQAALLTGLQSHDPEVRWRCVRLWAAVHEPNFPQRAEAFLQAPNASAGDTFPGWWRFRHRCGTSLAARRLFVEMQAAEPGLWAMLHDRSTSTTGPFGLLAERLQVQLSRVGDRSTIPLGSVATLWFLGAERPVRLTPDEIETLRKVAELPCVQDALSPQSPLQSLWLAWRLNVPDQRPAADQLLDFLRTGLPDEAQAIARQILQQVDAPAQSRQYALLALANSNEPTDEDLIQPFLEDPTPLGVYLSREVVIKTQLRDVALAAIIRRRGLDPRDFGFEHLREGATLLYSPPTLGFPDDAARRAAFAKWNRESPTNEACGGGHRCQDDCGLQTQVDASDPGTTAE
jgi:hypothetical protein